MASSTQQTQPEPAPWHAAYPAPKADAAFISREDVLKLLDPEAVASTDFVLVDLRRNDHQGGTIQGSVNLPAQSLWSSIPVLYNMFKAAGVRKVIWYCGSSQGRGCRAGGWFADYITDQADSNMHSLVLQGGIKGWVKAGGDYTARMQEYDAAAWNTTSAGP